MITVVKEFTFDSAHFLPNHPGLCKNWHGHTYRLQIGVTKDELNGQGMVMDFADLKKAVKPIMEALDHHVLNEVSLPGFPKESPTAEAMVLWFSKHLPGRLLQFGVTLTQVRLWETPTSYAEWIK